MATMAGNKSSPIDDDNVSIGSDDRFNVSSSNGAKADEQERETLARNESRHVAYLNGAVFVVLLIANVLVSTGVYRYMSYDQNKNFEDSYFADADKLLEALHKAKDRQIEAMDALSVAITSHAKSSGSVFPNVTLPDFGVRAAGSRALSGNFAIQFFPLVTDETRKGWEAYQLEHFDQYADDYAMEHDLRTRQNMLYNHADTVWGSENASTPVWPNPEILRVNDTGDIVVAAEQSGPYLPVWQMSPLLPNMNRLNFDTLSHPAFAGAHLEAIASALAVVDEAVDITTEATMDGTEGYYEETLLLSQYRKDIDFYSYDPTSAFAYPVFDSFDVDQRKVSGLLGSTIYWRLFFMNVLPNGTKGIICVLENTRNQSFSYEVSDVVTYLGPGDAHHAAFDDLERNVSHVKRSSSDLESKSFTSVDWNHDYCRYSLRVYPSQETKDQHVNRSPIWAMIVVNCVFLFTSLIFILYTIAVGRRQKVVMNRAVASGAIVSSLFPSQVRDQIYQANDAENTPSDRSEGFHSGDANGKQIASLFEATTIMFADMVGFTAWSAKRTPVQVFELLEALYQSFDAIAMRRKVFKVETIGDCYVAVAGLPEPQEDHAVIMVRFADACMTKMAQLTTELAAVLGEDTANLAMRVGLHSGSVTGGVLRGQKSRFQLFGDTMNTASRMESNGMPNRIHISQETANELDAKGKSSWIEPREDKIVAKGKGELQTYWATVRFGSASIADSATKSKGKSMDDDATYWL